jgi:pimeloyl-ACP methyl ester carboxylesterase
MQTTIYDLDMVHGCEKLIVVLPPMGVVASEYVALLHPCVCVGTSVVYVSYGSAYSTMQQLCARIWSALKVQLATGRPVVLFGFSYGGMVAQGMQSSCPDAVRIVGMVLASTTCPVRMPLLDAAHPLATLHSVDALKSISGVAAMFLTPEQRKLTKHLISTKMSHEEVDAQLRAGIDFITTHVCTNEPCVVPILFIHGEQDGIFPLADAKRAHGYLVNSDLIVVPGAGHDFIRQYAQETCNTVFSWASCLRCTDSQSGKCPPLLRGSGSGGGAGSSTASSLKAANMAWRVIACVFITLFILFLVLYIVAVAGKK